MSDPITRLGNLMNRIVTWLNTALALLILGLIVAYAWVVLPLTFACFAGFLLVLWLVCNVPYYLFQGLLWLRRRLLRD